MMNPTTILAAIAVNEAKERQKGEVAGPGFDGPPRGPFWWDLFLGLGLAILLIGGMLGMMLLMSK
jgi:hypothetical protein